MKINIIAVGKLQQNFKILFQKYHKQLATYAVINVIEIKEVNHKNKWLQQQKETELILARIPKKSQVFLCSLQGAIHSSEGFAKLFNQDNLTFIIGGSHGVDESKFASKICFSKLTFAHQLFRVMLIEQIYRAFSIKNNLKYHK